MSTQRIASSHPLIADNSDLICGHNSRSNHLLAQNVGHNRAEDQNQIKCKDIIMNSINNNVINESNHQLNNSSKSGNNCGLNINNMFAMPLNNISPLYLFNSEHNPIRNTSGQTSGHNPSTHLTHKTHLNNNLNTIREGSTPSPLSLSSISNHLNDSTGNAFLSSKPLRTSDGLISGLNFNHTDVLREGLLINYQSSPAENANSTPNSFTTSSLDGYLTGGQGGHSSNHSFDLLDSDSFSEMPNSLSPSCHNTYDDNSGQSFVDKKQTTLDPNSAVPTRKKRKGCPPVRPACPDCGKEFSNQSALSKHKLTHSDERRFVCNQCAKAFKRQDHLNGHLLTHRSKKPYECDVEGCEKTYCDARSLRRHKENHHPAGQTGGQNQSLQTLAFIPGIALNFSTTNVGLSANQPLNRIQYAPPPPVSSPYMPSGAESGEQSAATQLQRLALHKQENNIHNTISDKWVPTSRDSPSAQKWTESESVVNKTYINSNEIPKHLIKCEINCKMNSNLINESTQQSQQTQENQLLHQLLTQNEHTFKDKQPVYQSLPQTLPLQHPQQQPAPHHQQQQPAPQHHQQQQPAPQHHQQQQPVPHNQEQTQDHRPTHKLESSQPLSTEQSSHHSMQPLGQQSSQPVDNWPYTMFAQSNVKSEPPQVECTLCQRKFKNIPALNGHMRLHGGYLKNQSQSHLNNCSIGSKKDSKVNNNQMNANVKAILDAIKEKISRKQAINNMNTNLANNLGLPPPHQPRQQTTQPVTHLNSPMAPILSPITPVTPTTTGNTSSFSYDFHQTANNDIAFSREDHELYYENQIQLLKQQLQQTTVAQQFRMPSQPSSAQNRLQAQEQRQQQSRRHSDSSDMNANCVDSNQMSEQFDSYSTQQFNDLLRRRTQRTCSDPGSDQPLMTINTNYQSSQQQMFNHQFYHQSHSVPTTPTLCHNSSTLQPHSLPTTPTAAAAPINFMHSPHSQGSVPTTPTDANQQFNFIPLPSPINQGSVHSQYSTSPASVAAQYSPNTPSHTSVPQFTYSAPISQPTQQNTANVFTERMDDNYEESQMYDAINNYTNTGAEDNHMTEEQFNFGNNLNTNENYFESQNQMITQTTGADMQIDNQSIEQMAIQSIPQPKQQFFNNFQTNNSSHEYNPIVTTSTYGQSSHYWSQSSLTTSVQMNPQIKAQVLPQVIPNLTPKTSTDMVSNANCYSVTPTVSLSNHSSISYVTGISSQPNHSITRTPNQTLFVSQNQRTVPSIRRSTSSPPHLVVNLEKIDECDDETDDVFLSPVGVAPSPKRSSPAIPVGAVSPKRPKHRPEPLYIPPHVNTCGYQSRLRSPRLWDPAAIVDTKNLSPPPYTPPPMLSPVRSGPGLFWHIISGSMTPKSGTIAPKFVYSRKSSSDMREKEEPMIQSVVQTPTTAYEPFDCEIPETDIQPHVNIGPNFQARIPAFNLNKDEAKYRTEKADLVWDPSVTEALTDEDIENYLELSCCACIPGAGRNKEYAMHLLNMSGGDIHNAIVKLLEPHPTIGDRHPLHDYHYSENDIWVPQEIEAYQCALNKCDKDFFSISKEIGTKSVKQCIQFYYMWKKVCPDEYRRLRIIRRKREQETIFYNLRSKEEENNNNSNNNNNERFETDSEMDANNDNDMNGFANSGQSSDVEDNVSSFIDSANPSPATSVGSQVTTASTGVDYPCKLCGKVFQKVKSRSAHMKIHGSGSAKY